MYSLYSENEKGHFSLTFFRSLEIRFQHRQEADWGNVNLKFLKNWSVMKSSKKCAGETLFQLPFNGLGISLEACAEKAGKMEVRYFNVSISNSLSSEKPAEYAFTGLSGFELLLTLGREIRGR